MDEERVGNNMDEDEEWEEEEERMNAEQIHERLRE